MVYEVELSLGCDLVAELVNEVAGMGEIFRLLELPPAGLPQHVPDLRLKLRKLPPGLEDLGIVAERGDAGAGVILVAIVIMMN